MSLKLESVQLGMRYLHLLKPVANQRMGTKSKFFMALEIIEEKLATLLQSLSIKTKIGQTRAVNFTPADFKVFKQQVKDLKTELDLKKGSAVYQYLEGPTNQLLVQLEIITGKIPY